MIECIKEIKEIVEIFNDLGELARDACDENVMFADVEALGMLNTEISNKIAMIKELIIDHCITTTVPTVSTDNDDFGLDNTEYDDEIYTNEVETETETTEPDDITDEEEEKWYRHYSYDIWVCVCPNGEVKFYPDKNGEPDKWNEYRKYWVDNDLQIYHAENGYPTKRCSSIICGVAGIKSNATPEERNNHEWFINFKDGDRRNIHPSNLFWAKTPRDSKVATLIDDICRRLVDCDFDVNRVMDEYYTGAIPVVEKDYVIEVKNKLRGRKISDTYFTEDLKVISTTTSTTNPGLDVWVIFENTHDVGLAKDLLTNKVVSGVGSISIPEMMLMSLISTGDIDKPASGENIKKMFGFDIPKNVNLNKEFIKHHKDLMRVWEEVSK